MKQYTKEELQNLVTEVSSRVQEDYIEFVSTKLNNDDPIKSLTTSILQIQKNCEKIIIEVLNTILND